MMKTLLTKHPCSVQDEEQMRSMSRSETTSSSSSSSLPLAAEGAPLLGGNTTLSTLDEALVPPLHHSSFPVTASRPKHHAHRQPSTSSRHVT